MRSLSYTLLGQITGYFSQEFIGVVETILLVGSYDAGIVHSLFIPSCACHFGGCTICNIKKLNTYPPAPTEKY